jgi:hypothetical protein
MRAPVARIAAERVANVIDLNVPQEWPTTRANFFSPDPLPTIELAKFRGEHTGDYPINNGRQRTIAAPMRRYYHIPPAPDL